MKKLGLLVLLWMLVFYTHCYAQSSSATASSNAAAAAVMNAAPSSSASASIENISPSSSVKIETKAKSIYKNRQIISPPVITIPSPMQPFLTPRQLSPSPWNFLNVIEGKWKKSNCVKKIKITKLKAHIYRKRDPVDEVVVVSSKKILFEGEKIGEIILKGSKDTDSRELQMLAIDYLASYGANVIWISSNYYESEAVSEYSGLIIGGSGGSVLLYEEKAAVTGATGVGKGRTKLKFEHFPVIKATGYRGKIKKITQEKEERKEKEKKIEENERKKWEVIK